jgi:hypothetical protein
MFYKALGYVVWQLALRYLRLRFGRTARIAGLVAVASALAAAAYAATRSSE